MICDNIPPPPMQYDVGYTPPFIVQYVTQKELQIMVQSNKPFCGWTDVSQDPAVVYIVENGNVAQLLRHELGHVRGWRHPLPKNSGLSALIKESND